jgi:hypothetical protein
MNVTLGRLLGALAGLSLMASQVVAQSAGGTSTPLIGTWKLVAA